jgi:Beta-propeller repeat
MRSLGVVGISLSLLATSTDGPPAVRARHNLVQGSPVAPPDGQHVRARANDTYGKLPLYFEANRGQTDGRVKFLARGRGYTMFLAPTEAVLVLSEAKAAEKQQHFGPRKPIDRRNVRQTVIRTAFIRANQRPRVDGVDELPGKANYFIGNDPVRWRTNVPTYARVRYQDLYPGIDLVYYGRDRALEYDFVVHPGADPSRIALDFEGADGLEIDGGGNLVLHTGQQTIRQRNPLIYQEIDGVRQQISGRYVLKGDREASIEVSRYDESRPLIIDPAVLFYSTYLGGSSEDYGSRIAVDGSGNAYVTGTTYSADFPTTAGAFDTSFNSPYSSFVAKLNPTGSGLVYSTYLSHSIAAIALDSAGNAYLAGSAFDDCPATPGAYQTTPGGEGDVCVTKLNSTGSALVYSTYLGGTGPDEGHAIAVDAVGDAYVTGGTGSGDFPTTPAAYDRTFDGADSNVFVAKLNPTGSALLYSTYLGGFAPSTGSCCPQAGYGIAVDATGSAYVTGFTLSSQFPTTIGAFKTTFGGGYGDAFVTKLDPTGSALVYSTYLGGSDQDQAAGIALDTSGNAYIVGTTQSTDFPITAGAFQSTLAGSFDAFVTRVNANGSGVVYSTYLGGADEDDGNAIALDAAGEAYVSGTTFSADFPTTPGVFGRTFNGHAMAFVAKFDAAASGLVYSTYLGGSGQEAGNSVALDTLPVPNAYVTGTTSSIDFPTTPGAFEATFNGGGTDAFVVKIAEGNPAGGPFSARVTGGGTINVVGGIGTFGFMIEQSTTGVLSGRLQYINHASGARVVSDSYTSLMIVGNTATFNGTCGVSCSFTVNVIDNGEPGTTDTFSISVSNGPTEGGPLRSGNILIRQQ